MKKLFLIPIVAALALALIAATTNPGSFRAPTISTGPVATRIYWTAGSINNGGHSVAIVAGNALLDASRTSCAAPAFSACDFLYSDSAGNVAVTPTLATAVAGGNTLLALIETTAGSIPTNIALPQQSGTLWLQAGGPTLTGLTAITPSAAGTVPAGSAALPLSGAYIGTAATNNIFLTAAATAAARTMKLTDPGASGAFSFGDPSDATKIFTFDLSGLTTAKTITFASNSANSRTITFTDPGGAANVAYANPTSAQALTGISSITTSTAAPSTTGVVRLANTNLIGWRDAANGSDISLQVNGSNNLVLTGATAPTDGFYFIGPEYCSMALTTGAFAANQANSGGLSAPSVVKAATGNTVLQLVTTAAANTTEVTCSINPPTRISSGKGVTITTVEPLFGYQTTALTSIGTAGLSTVTYGAAGAAAQGTVAAFGGAITVTAGTNHGIPGAVTTSGQCFHETLSLGTPYAHVTDNVRLTYQQTFAQSAAAATTMQFCGVIVRYSNINAL